MFIVLMLLCALSISAQESLKPEMQDPRVPVLVDSAATLIPGDDSLLIQQEELADSIGDVSDSSKADSSEAIDDSLFIPIESGISFGVRWGFTTSFLFNSWATDQKGYNATVYQTFKDMDFPVRSRWLREPENQSITFPVSVAYFKRFNDLTSITTGGIYSFRSQKSVFMIEEDSVDTPLFKYDARFSQQHIELFFSFQYRFNPEYFSIDAVDASGIDIGIGIIPISLLSLHSESTSELNNRDAYSRGFGGSWHAALFTEKQISQNIMNRIFFCYHGSISTGFKNHDELLSLEARENWKEESLTFSENFFELGFIFTFSQKTVVEDEE